MLLLCRMMGSVDQTFLCIATAILRPIGTFSHTTSCTTSEIIIGALVVSPVVVNSQRLAARTAANGFLTGGRQLHTIRVLLVLGDRGSL